MVESGRGRRGSFASRPLRLMAGAGVLLVAALAAGAAPAADVAPTGGHAQDVAPTGGRGRDMSASGGRIQSVTRLVRLFLDKNAALGAGIRAGNVPAVEAMLTDDFELRTGANPASPIPRENWVAEVVRSRDPGGAISRMAVHEYPGLAVASYMQAGASGPMFVVDVWRGQGDDWKLAVRYASPAGTAAFAIPGGNAREPEIPKKY